MPSILSQRFALLAMGTFALADFSSAQATTASEVGATAPRAATRPAAQLAGGQQDIARLQRWANILLARTPNGPDATPFQSSAGFAFLTQIAVPAEETAAMIPGSGGTVLLMRIWVESTLRDELFTVYVPDADPSIARPLLTCFHAYGLSHLDIAANTTYLREAQDRDWYMIAPLQHGGAGLFDVNYGSAKSALHVETVIDYMLRNYLVDRDRLYAVGFSMGGGSALSYAARYRDRRSGAFAAVMNHTGTVALADVYANVNANVRSDMFELFGGTPTDRPFQYKQSSVVVLDSNGLLDPAGDHMAVNLEPVPILTIYGTTDPLVYLINQQNQLATFMATLPDSAHTLQPTVVPNDDTQCQSNAHCWGTADEFMVCDWLAQHSLESKPLRGTVRADRDARWYHFDVDGEVPEVFATFDFDVDLPSNQMRLTSTANIRSIGVRLDKVGLSTINPINLEFGTSDGSHDRYDIRGLDAPPSIVLRNGMQVMDDPAAIAAGTVGWTYDSSARAVVICDDGANWVVIPS